MDSFFGNFHREEVNEKPYLVYNHLDSPDEQILFLCPIARIKQSKKLESNDDFFEVNCSLYFNGLIKEKEYFLNDFYKKLDTNNHPVLPLFWCKNKDGNDVKGKFCSYGCLRSLCDSSDYYLCVTCDKIHHKECVEAPFEIKHPFHPIHSLKLCFFDEFTVCDHCRNATRLVYHCTQCNFTVHPGCAQDRIPFLIKKPKRHDHFLTFLTREDPLRCNVCGLRKKTNPTYVCLICNFVAHKDCAYSPSVIRISRHHHRISFISSLPTGEWICGVCRRHVDNNYGGYTCKKCDNYVVHPRCALRIDIWDEEELEDVPEDDDIDEVVDPFERINDGMILHFSHDHCLQLISNGGVYDESKICHACVLPIYDNDFYSCMECDFILHDKCANAPCKIQHPLHPHPLTLKVSSGYDDKGYFTCSACKRWSSGFVYECNKGEHCFKLDVRCGFISEPLDYQGHEHPLFLALDPRERESCQICLSSNIYLINCIECDFIICLKCVTLPYLARYKHDKHFLELTYWEETNEVDWCEVCERVIFVKKEEKEDEEKRFYWCKQCCTSLHLDCLLGRDIYLKSGNTIKLNGIDVQVQPNNSLTRPTCDSCLFRCVDKIFFRKKNSTLCKIYCHPP